MRLEQGSDFAGYRIIRLLGEGGMGAVYLAKHPRLPREDALKLLSGVHASNAEFRGRFEREADVAASLRHPNIVSVYDRGAEGDQLWISMQYVEGVDAAELVRAGPQVLTPQRALVIIGDAAKGLDYAHRQGVLHRDVKPANILVTGPIDDTADESALLADFGIARAMQSASEGLTMPGFMVGTTAYAAPEMLRGTNVDHRVDVYALACTLYEMLTGRQPFQRDSVAALMHAHLNSPPPIPSQARPGLPPALDRVIARGLAKDPNQRYNSCRELYHDAARALGVTTSGTSPSYPAQTPPPQQQYVRPPQPAMTQPVTPPPSYLSTPNLRPPMGPPPSQVNQRPPQRGTNKALVWGAVAAVVLLVIGGVALVVGLSGSDTQSQSGTTTSSRSSETSSPEESTSEESSTETSAPQLPAGPTAESDDHTFVVSIPADWNNDNPDKLMRLYADNGFSNLLVTRNPSEFWGADVSESADIGAKQIIDQLNGKMDAGGIESSTVGGEPAAKITYTLLAADGHVPQDARGRQYYVRHNNIEYIITCTGAVDTFNSDVADFEYILNSWTWIT